MLNDWIQWLSSVPRDQIMAALMPLWLLDAPRYVLGSLMIWFYDVFLGLLRIVTGREKQLSFTYYPSVCVVIAGLNESETIARTLETTWGTYPDLEIIVVDDGSTDETSSVARQFAATHAGVLVVRRHHRGGKSSALNHALEFASADIIVGIDADVHLGPNAIWELVQPFADPRVGAVSGSVLARNKNVNLGTRLQAFEYLRCIFVGRQVASRLGVLGIVSGAFGGFRRSVLTRMMGWDVGPGEDGDLTLRIRKAGFNIAFAPYAQCFTNLPTTWQSLFRQRRRWDWATITFECRKHGDLANIFSRNFRFGNLVVLLDRWLFNVLLVYGFWAYAIWLCFNFGDQTLYLILLYYVLLVGMELSQLLIVLYYSNDRRRDIRIGWVAPFSPIYHLVLRLVTLLALTEEILFRRSFKDNFVPKHVRSVTWHW